MMKNPWVAFAGICSVVLGIVLFSIVFGGYSSFLRAQKRIDVAKGLLIDQCRNQLTQVETLTGLPGSSEDAGHPLLETAQTAAGVLDRMEKAEPPLAKELIAAYEDAQVRLNTAVDQFLQKTDLPKNQDLNQFIETQTAVFLTARQYNKAANYFNSRIQVFPGFIIARIFGIDKIYYTIITVDLLDPSSGKEAAGVS